MSGYGSMISDALHIGKAFQNACSDHSTQLFGAPLYSTGNQHSQN
jgi:hypothetical protein